MAARAAPARGSPLSRAISLPLRPCAVLLNDRRLLPRCRIRLLFAQPVRQSRGAVLSPTAHPSASPYLLPHILRQAIRRSQCLLDRRVTQTLLSDRTGARLWRRLLVTRTLTQLRPHHPHRLFRSIR